MSGQISQDIEAKLGVLRGRGEDNSKKTVIGNRESSVIVYRGFVDIQGHLENSGEAK